MIIAAALIYGALAAIIFRLTTNPQRLRRTTNQILARIMEFRLFVDEPSLIWRAQLEALKANLTLLREIALPCLIMAAIFALLYPTLSRGPLRFGEVTVMTSHTDTVPHIYGVTIETPGVRIPRTGEVSWRIRVVHPVIGNLPSGVEIQTPRTSTWLLWFFVISSLTAGLGSFWHHPLAERHRLFTRATLLVAVLLPCGAAWQAADRLAIGPSSLPALTSTQTI